MKRPNSRRNLDIALTRLSGQDENFIHARTLIANGIIGQMLTNVVVKGGSSLKIRFGDAATRATTDLDAARASDLESFISDLEESLAKGWEGFTGQIKRQRPARPQDVPSQYVMQPYEIKLSYLGSSWCTVDFEVGHDEIGDAEDPELIVPEEADNLLQAMSFPPLEPVPLMPLHYQIAQKLHGVSEPESKRAHDLIDLQIIMQNTNVNLVVVRHTCERLFAYRKMQPWPTRIVLGDSWKELYASQLFSLPVRRNVMEAIGWTNDLIDKMLNAQE